MDALDLMGLPYLFDQCDPGLTEAAGGRYLRFDFVVYYGPAVTVIEFDGEQHERPATFGGITAQQAAEAFERLRESDAIKNEHCAAMGYRLLRIQAADLMRAPRLIGDFFRTRLGWAPGRPLPPDTPAIPRAPAVEKREADKLAREALTVTEKDAQALALLRLLGFTGLEDTSEIRFTPLEKALKDNAAALEEAYQARGRLWPGIRRPKPPTTLKAHLGAINSILDAQYGVKVLSVNKRRERFRIRLSKRAAKEAAAALEG